MLTEKQLGMLDAAHAAVLRVMLGPDSPERGSPIEGRLSRIQHALNSMMHGDEPTEAQRIDEARAVLLDVWRDIEAADPDGADTNDLACACAALRDVLGRRYLQLTGEMLLS